MTAYFVKNGGSDALSGLSDANAWATCAKVNGFTFAAGDTVSFKCGSLWRETLTVPRAGSSGARMVYNSYGTGNKPRIYGSDAITGWTVFSGNIWQAACAVDPGANAPGTSSPGSVYFVSGADGVTWGHAKKATTGDLAAEFDWTWASGTLYVYAATDPDTRYASVEATHRGNCVEGNQKDYLTIDGIECRFAARSGILLNATPSSRTDATISNCVVGWIGVKGGAVASGILSAYSNTLIDSCIAHDIGRRAIEVTVFTSGVVCDGWRVTNCEIYDGSHAGFDIALTNAGGTINNVEIDHNFAWQSTTEDLVSPESFPFGFNDLVNSGGGTCVGVKVHHNVLKNSGTRSISLDGLTNVEVYNNTCYGNNVNATTFEHIKITSTCVNVIIKNNIFVMTTTGANWYDVWVGATGIITAMDYNLHYHAAGVGPKVYGLSGGSSYTTSQWATYKSATGFDAHSPNPADPLLAGTGTEDTFTLSPGSPAINAGVVISGITDGYSGPAPDLGALESPTTYFVKNGGSNALDGLSDATAWATVAKVNGFTFTPGDTVSFKCGSLWREQLTIPTSGTSGHVITFGSYSTGAKPRLLGSTALGSWTNESGSLWYATLAADPTVTWFVNGSDVATVGRKLALKASLGTEFDWWFDSPNSRLYVFSPTNPGTRYASVEPANRSYGVDCNSKDYVAIDGLDIRYTKTAGVRGFASATRSGLTVQNCHVGWIGIPNVGALGVGNEYGIISSYGGTLITNNTVHDCGRRGITIQPAGSGVVMAGWECSYNTVYNCYHSGIDMRFENGVSISAVNVHHNRIYQDPTTDLTLPDGNWQFFGMSLVGYASAWFEDATIHHNTFEGVSDKGIYCDFARNCAFYNNSFHGNHPDQSAGGAHVQILVSCSTGFVFKNNIFHGTNAAALDYPCIAVNGRSKIATCDYNLFYQADGAVKIFRDLADSSSYTMAQWTSYKSTTGFDAHSPTPANPLLTDPANGDFTLQAGSPAINAGVVIAGITDGYSGAAPDIGAFEVTGGMSAVLSGTGLAMTMGDVRAGGRVLQLDLTGTTWNPI